MTNAAPADGGGSGLTTYDPWPGDPAAYEDVAARLTDREIQANQVRSGILGMINDPDLGHWLGESANAFKQTLGPLPTLLGQMVYAYGTAAQAVHTFAGQLRDGRASFAKMQSALLASGSAPRRTAASMATSTATSAGCPTARTRRRASTTGRCGPAPRPSRIRRAICARWRGRCPGAPTRTSTRRSPASAASSRAWRG
ncbi:hypothetical protein ACFQ9X_36470 [Catenulispora yoronensis]